MTLGCLCAAHAQSLVQLTEQAQFHDAQWQSARAQLDATISQGAQAKAGLLPQVGLQAGTQYSDSRSRFQTSGIAASSQLGAQQHTAAIQATQALYNPSKLVTYQQGQRSVDVAYAQVDAAAQDLLVRTAQAYFSVLEAQDNLRLVMTQKQAVSEQFEFAQRNFEIGTATVTDSREAQARLDLVRAQEIAAVNELQVRQAALEQLVATASPSPWPLTANAPLPQLTPANINHWLATANAENPLVRQAQIALEIAALETEKAQAGHKPTVDLQASYGYQRNPDGSATTPGMNNVRSNVGTVGVVMNLPLFAGFAVQNRVRETLSLEEKARADLEDTRRQVNQAVRTAYFGVQSAYGQVQALEAAVASSQSALDANRLGYEVGVRINMDVLNAQSQLFQAQRDLAQARYNLLLGHLQLRQATGTLAMQDVHEINQLLSPTASLTKK
ncbi:MAG: TolC family outer membrane protein [Comamonas sp.]|nr:TolC family outer membrane protein [Comamonas sp.]